MSKYLLIGIIAVTIVVGLASGYYFFNWKSNGGPAAIIPSSLIKKEVVTGDSNYEDESGFSFDYPKGVKVSDITPESDDYYSKLSLTKGNGKLLITVKDISAKTPDVWLKEEGYEGATLTGATSLGGISAKQYYSGDNFITIAIDQGIAYSIVGLKDGGYWEDVQGVLVSSFVFAGNKPATSGGGDNTIYENEEVVE